MLLKLKKAFPIIIFAVVTVAIGSVLFEKCGNGVDQKSFLIKMDSLNKVNDSLNNQIAKDDAVIDSLNEVDAVLSDKLAHQKTKVIKIVETIEIEKNNIDSYNEQELVSSFYKRYPTDTVSNPLPVAQPVLVSAAKDLVELDGAKQIIIVKDSVIALTEARVTGKDSVIAVYIKKEGTYKNIMTNQDTQIKDWKNQYQQLYLQNQKLKFKNKITKIGAGVIVGGLVYLMVAK